MPQALLAERLPLGRKNSFGDRGGTDGSNPLPSASESLLMAREVHKMISTSRSYDRDSTCGQT
jgi:hypothetical protein